MNKIQILEAASKAIVKKFPQLDRLVRFDIEFDSCSTSHFGFSLRVEIKDRESYVAFKSRTGFPKLYNLLDAYQVNDTRSDFELEGLQWLIGDGDDFLAVREITSWEVAIWVRTFSGE